MALEDLSTATSKTTTSMPSWYNQAQQQAITGATSAASAAPALQNTAAQTAVDMFSNAATNPYMQGQQVLGQIAQGAVNPFTTTTDAAGNMITAPNVSTPMGGLFAAQQQYLNELMPSIDATATAPYLAGGGFGSRMNLSALGQARSQAANELFKNQMQSALSGQQIGASAASGLGNIGTQQLEGALKTGTYETSQPFASSQNLAAILSQINPQKTQTTETTGDLYSQLAMLGSATTGGLQALGDLFPNLKESYPNIFKALV
jgi:hypothetical protein